MNKIVKYNAINARLSNSGLRITPHISLQKGGQFRLNRALLELIGAKVDDGIEFIHDKEEGEWYVGKAKADGLILRKGGNGGSVVHCAVVADLIKAAMENTHGAMGVSTQASTVDGSKCYAILIGSAKVRAQKKAA